MCRKLLLFLAISSLLTACSTDFKITDEIGTSTVPETEEISPLEEISTACLEGYKLCRESYIFKKDEIENLLEKEILDNYTEIYVTLSSKLSTNEKLTKIEKNIRALQSKGYNYIIERYKKDGNVKFAQLVEEKVWPLAKSYNTKNLYVGMDVIQLIVSAGYPNDINKTTTASGVHSQWVYKDFETYVYLENNVVTSFQN